MLTTATLIAWLPAINAQTEPEPTEPSEAPFITTEQLIITAVVVAIVIAAVSIYVLRRRQRMLQDSIDATFKYELSPNKLEKIARSPYPFKGRDEWQT